MFPQKMNNIAYREILRTTCNPMWHKVFCVCAHTTSRSKQTKNNQLGAMGALISRSRETLLRVCVRELLGHTSTISQVLFGT